MATSNPNRFAEPTIIGTESEARQYAERKDKSQPTAKKGKTTFDTDAFLQREEEKMRAAEEMERKVNARISEYSIPWNFMDKLPPLPGMKLNAGLVRWEPEDLDAFVSEYGEEVKSSPPSVKRNKKPHVRLTSPTRQREENLAVHRIPNHQSQIVTKSL